MRRLVISALLSALLVTGCAKRETGSPQGSDLKTFDVAESSDKRTPPDIGPSAAPGVAFDYKYAFRLTDEKISAVQEAHAARCEAMGLAKCRITGLDYTIGDNDLVTASLVLKLDPQIARSFGREATATVTQAGGRLTDTEFTGEDTAPSTDGANASAGDAAMRAAAIQQQLASKGARDAERAQLQTQLAALQSQASDAKATLAQAQTRLAATPMTFTYYGKGGISGFGGRNPLVEAGQSFIASMVTMISLVLQLLAYVLPWVLLLTLLLLMWRTPPLRAVRRWWRGKNVESEDVPVD